MSFSETTLSVVVGGTSGIGRAVAAALARRPGRVVSVGRSTGLDVSDPEAVERFLASLGTIDHVVFTAGSQAPGGKVADVAVTAAQAAFAVKFWGSINVVRGAASRMAPGGSITLTSGFLSRRAIAGTYVKTAMNAALEATARVLALELAPVRVNVVSPGLTDTEAYAGMDGDSRRAMFENSAASLPARRVATPEDVAAGYLFAIDNPSVTGSVIDIDGGARLK